MWKISDQAAQAYNLLLEDSSVLHAVLSSVDNYPGASPDSKHDFGRELLTRIKSQDDRKYHTTDKPKAHEVWKHAFHLGLSQSPRWDELLEKSQSFGMEQANHAELCTIAWLLAGLNPPRLYHGDSTDLSELQRQKAIGDRLGIQSSNHDQRIDSWMKAYHEYNDKLITGDTITEYCQRLCDQAVENALQSLDFTRSGELTGDMPGMKEPEQVQKVAITVTYAQPHVQKILNMMGRMKGMFSFCRTTSGSKKESVRYESGNDITRLVLDEHCKEDDQFYLEFAERKLSQYRSKITPKGSGPVIVLIDETGSMNDTLSGEPRYVWAKAFALMVSKISKQQNRECLFIGFGGYVLYTISNKSISNRELETLTHFHGAGSTYWKPALKKALEIISKDVKYKKADIILLTDGEDPSIIHDFYFLEKLAAEKKRIDLKVHGILIGSNRSSYISNLEAVSDVVLPIKNFKDTTNLKNVIKGL
jgi:hypothetical protein